MLDNLIGFIFSALLGIGLMVLVVVLARNSMMKEMKKQEKEQPKETSGDKLLEGASGGNDPS